MSVNIIIQQNFLTINKAQSLLKLHASQATSPTMISGLPKQNKPLNGHLRALSGDNDNDNIPTTSPAPADPSGLWMTEYNDYLNTRKFVLGEMGTVQWWGVHSILKLFHTVHLLLGNKHSHLANSLL